MKATITKTVEVEVSFIRLAVAVRYDDEDMPYDFPFRKNDIWDVTVDIETGRIVNWPGWPGGHKLYMKVCDQGTYWLLAPDKSVVVVREDNYVPNKVIPWEYGDYIKMDIAEDGKIQNWPKRPDLSKF